MADTDVSQAAAAELRRRAEEAWRQRAVPSSGLTFDETNRLIHELEVHQIELEMQNAALRRAHDELAASHDELAASHDELAASHARYLDLFDRAPVGYLTLDAKGRILEANLAAADLLGIGRDKLAGQLVTRFIHRDDQDAFYLHRKQLSRARGAEVSELRLRRPGGATRWVSIQSVMIEGGEREGASRVTLTDVSERKQADEQIRFQAGLLQAVDQAVIVVDLDMAIIYWNPSAEQLYGWTVKEALGRRLRELVTPGLLAQQAQDLMASLQGGRAWSGELGVARKDGRTVSALIDFSPVRDPQGKLVGAISVSRDNMPRRRIEDDLRLGREQLRNLSRRLVSVQESERESIAHQLYDDESQRLAAVLLTLGAIERDATQCPKVMLGVEEAKQMVSELMRDLHGLATNLRPAVLDRLGLVSALSQYAEQLANQHGLGIHFQISGASSLHLGVDVETGIYRIVQEALSNAVRHSGAREIGIVATRHDNRLVVVVEDDGQGFDVDEALRLGRLGLLGMQERAQMLGGNLTIESEPGKGTAVYVEVPLRAP